MRRAATLGLVIGLLLPLGALLAHEKDVLYDRKDPIVLVVKFKTFVKIEFWEPVVDYHTLISESLLTVKKDKDFKNSLQVANIGKQTSGMLYVTTLSGAVVHFQVRSVGEPLQKMIVKDARTEAQLALEKVHQESGLTPDERTVRQLWQVQWGFITDPLVQVRDMDLVIEKSPTREVRLIKRYDTVGFYGFTQKVSNLRASPEPFHPATLETNCPVFSVSLDGHQPPLRANETERHVIEAGGSVLVHFTCEGPSRATLR